MLTQIHSRSICTTLVFGLLVVDTMSAISQAAQSQGIDLSGRWELNREASENAQSKLETMQASSGSGHRPPAGMHGLGRLFGGQDSAEEARKLFLSRPTSFTVRQDGERVELSESNGRVRVLRANGQMQNVEGRDVRTRWDGRRLVSEVALGNAKVTETFDRVTNAAQLSVTTRLNLQGNEVSVRRVYDLESAR